jgi:hypothetical protein
VSYVLHICSDDDDEEEKEKEDDDDDTPFSLAHFQNAIDDVIICTL